MQHHVQAFCRRRRVWPGSLVAATAVSLVTLSSLQLPTAVQCIQTPHCTTGCWCCDSSRRPRHVACITVQLITVSKSKCPVSPSLYNRRLRLSRLSRVIAIRLVPDCKWLPLIPSDPIMLIEASPSLGTCYSTAYMSRLEQQHFTISAIHLTA